MSTEQDERLRAELALLSAMYPEQVTYIEKSSEVSFSDEGHALLILRLPHDYLISGLPEVISATAKKIDLRDETRKEILKCEAGEEILDTVITAFQSSVQHVHENFFNVDPRHDHDPDDSKATILVWLHHLLNTNKRKQAISPEAASVSGLTKPGYPGVLMYSGPAKAVRNHVNELKQLNWQAFQVRLETEDEWNFAHGSGVVEVGSMGELVAEIGDARKQEFLEAMKIK